MQFLNDNGTKRHLQITCDKNALEIDLLQYIFAFNILFSRIMKGLRTELARMNLT
jgi:hypothetical protein